MWNFILVSLGLLLSPRPAHSIRDDRSNCKPVTASFCQGVGYTSTSYPSGISGYSLQQIGQIVETACSTEVATLMCRVAMPECSSDDDSRTKPCRSLCEKVKTDCESAIRAKRLSWPTKLRCEALPVSNCAQGKETRITPTPPTATCQAITIPLCKDLLYTETVLPNLLGHKSQEEANLDIHPYYPLVKVECSPHLKPFLCSLFTPQCVAGKALQPCRTLCEKARSDCGSLMSRFGFAWPESFRCDAFTTESCQQDDLVAQPSLTCQTITVPLCKDLPYTETVLPNLLGHKSQEEANLEINQFSPLVKVECSPHLKPFLCSLYTPPCVAGKARPPCRTLCEQARSGCELLMSRFGFVWPEAFRCEAFTTESCQQYGVGTSGDMCEPITIPLCQGLSYNQTTTQNLLGHANQGEAMARMSFFNSLVQTMCSEDIRLLLCRVYAPECVAGEVQRPCRSFCERAKQGCEDRMKAFGISWPPELQCNSFPEEMCASEERRTEMLNAEGVLAKLNAGGFSVRGKSLSLRTARLLLTLMDTDVTRDLDAVEFFKLEHYMATLRREYVESYERRNPPSVTQRQMKKALSDRGFAVDDDTFTTLWQQHGSQDGINYDEYTAAVTKLHILKERFTARLLSLPCDCEVSSFSLKQFLKSAII
ncbi:uncharacterized protein LOC131471632 [Solea solea]|uniref:uncharacterized protein LOC131471632 n=1 Tax=Solea solea TaxID=90069 RepID=UPI00272A134B|nr:uncharacterized protein LOC131471632 [Solea solea]